MANVYGELITLPGWKEAGEAVAEKRKEDAYQTYIKGYGKALYQSNIKKYGVMRGEALTRQHFFNGGSSVPVAKKVIKPVVTKKSTKTSNAKKEAVKSGLFGSSASGTQANTNVILSGKSSPEVTIASLERAAKDLETGIAGATMADHLSLAVTYEQFGKIQAHVSSDGHISLKEIEDTIRQFNPSLSDALVAHCAALIAKEMHLASDKLYPVEVKGASITAQNEVPKSMRKINVAKFALLPLLALAVWFFVFKKK